MPPEAMPAPVLAALVASGSALLTAVVIAVVTARREERKRLLEFKERQLREFYGPLWAQRREILAISNFRNKVEGESIRQAQEAQKAEGYVPPHEGPGVRRRITEEILDPHIDYSNKQLFEVLLPAYRRMQEIFRDNLHCAEPETLDHFEALVMFNDNWRRFELKGVSVQVGAELGVNEKLLYPLYDHIDAKLHELGQEVRGKRGSAPKAQRLR